VKELPLNGRSYDLLMTLNPGVVNFTSQKTGGIGVSNSTTGTIFRWRESAAAESVLVEWRGVIPGRREQYAAGRDQPAVAGRGRSAGIQCAGAIRTARNMEAAGRAGGDRDAVGTNALPWGACLSSCGTMRWMRRTFFDQGSAPPFQRNQFGGALGGPVFKDKTFVFGNYEGFRQNLHQTSAAFVPDLASRAMAAPSVQPLLICGRHRMWERRISTELRKFSAVRCRPFARILGQCGWIIFSRTRIRCLGLYD